MQGEDNGIPAGGTLTNTDSAPPSPRDGTLSEDAVDATTTQRSSQLPLVSVPSDFYAMEQEVGRGGVGVVTKAHDRRLGRSVALKRLQRPEPQARLRFEREMRITAKLQHPGVVPIHEAGVLATGEPFYAMKLVEGRSLKELIGERKSIGERLQLLPNLVAVIETIAYAHNVGIIHRDIKPSNIIVGAYGETVVIDWGLAKDLAVVEDETFRAGPFRTSVSGVMTVTGQIVGTPAYMPPEQAEGADVDRRADVYALGAVLRQLLTGAAPYSGRSSQDVLKAVLAAPPKSLAEVAPDAPKDLAAIANKAMAREASHRYADAAELLGDLKRFLNGTLVSAYAYAPTERLRKWAAARRGVVVTAAIAAVILVGVGAVSVARIIKERDAALESRRATVTQSNALLREQSGRELDQGNVIRAFEILKAYPRDATDWDKVYPLVHRIGMAGLPDFWAHPIVPASLATRAAIDQSGTLIGVASSSRLEVWSISRRRMEYAAKVGGNTTASVFELESLTIGSRTVWTVALDSGELVIAEMPTNGASEHTTTYKPCGDSPIADTASEAGQARIAVSCHDGNVVLLDVETGQIQKVTKHAGAAEAVAFGAGHRVVSVGTDGEMQVSTMSVGGFSASRISIGEPITVVSVHPTCERTIIGTADGTVMITSSNTQPIEYKTAGDNRIFAVGIDDECRLAFALDNASRLTLIDLSTQSSSFKDGIGSAAFYPNRSALVTGSLVGAVEYWEPVSGWKQSWRVNSGTIWRIVVSPQGIIGAFGDVLVAYLPGRTPRVHALMEPAVTLATSGDEAQVLVGGRKGSVALFDVAAQQLTENQGMHDGVAYVKAGGQRAFYSAGARDGCILRWRDGMSAEIILCIPGGVKDLTTAGTESVYAITAAGSVVGYDYAFPDRYPAFATYSNLRRIGLDGHGNQVIASSVSGDVHFLSSDLDSRRTINVLHPMSIASGLPSGRILAVTDDGPILDITEPLQPPAILTSCDQPLDVSIHGARRNFRSWFAPEGDRLLVGCINGQVLAWPLVLGLDRIAHAEMVTDVDGRADGEVFVSCSQAGTVSIIDNINRDVRATSTLVELENTELLSTKGYVVVVAKKESLFAVWNVAEMAESYPLDDADLFDWLHKGESSNAQD